MGETLTAVPLLGWWALPLAGAVTAGAVGSLWWARTRHRAPHTQVMLVVAAAAVAVLLWEVVDVRWRPVADGVGAFVWTLVGVTALVVLQALAGPWRAAAGARQGRGRQGRGRRALGVLGSAVCVVAAVLAVVLAAALAANAHFATYRTLGSALGGGVHPVPLSAVHVAPVTEPAGVARPVASWWVPPDDLPARGTVAVATVPASDPGFRPRDALIYLPPAYLGERRPELPVLVLMAGVPGRPLDWFTAGELARTMDGFAAGHEGLAPVVVVVDPLGGTLRNPLCSDTARGAVATYLQRDVPAWVGEHLQAQPDPHGLAVGGVSNGGTCTMQVVTRAPEVYPTFLDLSGEPHPTLGGAQRTLQRGYGGDRALLRANDYRELLATRSYPGVAGIISVGRDDRRYLADVQQVFAEARRAGMDVRLREYPGGHSWSVWSVALADQLPWLAGRLGLVAP